MPGTVLTRAYRGRKVTITVPDAGFEYATQTFGSLTGIGAG